MTSPTQQTVEYRERAPARSQPERVRVALVGGSGVSQSDDLYRLLRQRLLALSLFLAGVKGALDVQLEPRVAEAQHREAP